MIYFNNRIFNIMKSLNIYIGKIIAEIMANKKITKAELARRLNVRPQSVDYMLSRKSIDTDTLYKVSQALDYDFAQFYTLENKQTNSDTAEEYSKFVKARLIVEVELDNDDLRKLNLNNKLLKILENKK